MQFIASFLVAAVVAYLIPTILIVWVATVGYLLNNESMHNRKID
jgi:hypothetical protein